MARERRPDLEAAPYKSPAYIGMQLMPGLTRMVKAGTYYYQDVYSETSVQTDRTLADAPTATSLTSSSGTWSMAELIKRYKIDQSEIEQLGGLDAAQAKGARAGKRLCMGRLETLIATAIWGSGATTANILNSLIKAVETAKWTVSDYTNGANKIALFGSRRNIDMVKRYAEVVDRMKYTGVLIRDIRDVRSISDEQLAAALDVDVVIGGPNTEWGMSGTYDQYLGVAALPDPATDPDEEIQLGRTFLMGVPNEAAAGNVFNVETFFSDDLISEVVDTRLWYSLEVLNTECLYLLSGIDELNASSTTTTTTTGA